MTGVSPTTAALVLELLAERQGTAPVTVRELGRLAGLGHDETGSVVPAVLAVAGAFGVLRQDSGPDDAASVEVISPQAAYFLRSLVSYMRSGQSILDNWERAGTDTEPFTSGQALAGPQFLHLAETRRLALNPGALPLRDVEVVQVVIKSRRRHRGGRACYLLQYDQRARQYQLPGGYVRGSDVDLRAAAVRELEEELHGYTYQSTRDTLTELGVVNVVQPSRTYGALTRYRVAFFLLKTGMELSNTGPGACWIDEDDLLDSEFRVGRASLNVTALRNLAATLPGGLSGLPWSLPFSPSRGIRAMIRDHPWEVAGLVIGVIGLAVSLIPLFL
ncbi:NUDIX hydrolase [Streptomyces sp. NPDC001980]|uniref:NUDIX hydrolase n=1 Tax=Streptomyces sp. NPDC001980 TaxID=3157126 RepID=UPI003333E3ED